MGRRPFWSLSIALSITVAVSCAACGEGPSSATSPSCSFRVTVQSNSFGPSGGNGTAAVSTSPGCAWSAASSADWISVSSSASGSGDGQVGFTVGAYDGLADRSGSLVVAKQTLAIAQTACSIQFSPAEQSFSDGSSTRDVALQAQPGCRWSLDGAPSWLTMTPSTGAGDATVKIQVSENDGATPREATVRAGNATLSVKQGSEPERCNFALDVQPAQFNETGGHGVVAVNTREGCTWQLAADGDWIKLSSSSGTGPSRVSFDVSSIAQPADRHATLRIDGATAPVVQFANQCSFGVTPVQQYAHFFGDSGSVSIRAGAGCQWTASPAAPWVHIDKTSGTGPATIGFTVDPFTELEERDPRKAPIEVRWNTPTLGENAWIWQFSDCHIGFALSDLGDVTPGITRPSPNGVAFPPEGGHAHLFVLFAYYMRCQWTAENPPAPPFVAGGVPYNSIWDHEADLHIWAPPNTTGQTRTTSTVIGGVTVTITQPSK